VRFVRSLTVARSEIIEFLRLWEISRDLRVPFEYLILTPLLGLTDQSRVVTVKQYFAGRSQIIFDSGGYAVQQGIISYEDLYQRLLNYYRENDWANAYVLPDYVPTSGLSEQEVESRVQATITVARLFHAEMPASLRERALPVVQGHTRKQIQMCVETYMELGAKLVGFGSFGTTGISSDINIVTSQSIELLTFLLDLGARFGFQVHALGVGSPTLLPTLHQMGVYSFDSSCWLRTAGFGNVLMPFVKRRNITAGRLRERAGHRPLTSSEFQELQQETGHTCFFCTSFEELKHRRFYQILHNLTVMMDTVESLNRGDYLENPLIAQTVEASPYTRAARRIRAGLSR
jgi:queuine tRNA-ribosyltransferase-like protein